jgi:cytochrome c oxidase subunit II
LSACAGPLSILDPATGAAGRIADIWWIMLAVATLVLLGVLALFGLSFRRKSRLARLSPRLFLVGGGLVLPIVPLTALFIYAVILGQGLLPPRGDDVVRVEARGQQFFWEFSHFAADGTAIRRVNELHLPAGRPVEVTVLSADVIHSFWVPRLAGKIDAVPGHRNRLWIDRAPPGTYQGVCAEFCGRGHTQMQFRVIVHPAGQYPDVLATLAAGDQP